MKWALAILLAAFLATSSAGTAFAQSKGGTSAQSKGGRASTPSIGGSVYVTYGDTRFASTETFEAITGASSTSGAGVGGTVTGLWRGVFVDVAYPQQTLTGERVFIDQGTVYSLGIPTRITMRPIDLAAGWRFHVARRVTPFVGGGVVFMTYREESDFSVSGEDVDEQKTGGLVLGGADVRVVSRINVGIEMRYRSIRDILGSAGVSQEFGEDQLGGVSFAARVSVQFP